MTRSDVPPYGTIDHMDADLAHDSNGALPADDAASRSVDARLLLMLAAVLLAAAVISQFAVEPTGGPGFTYLAVALALSGLGALMATGLAE